MSLVSICDVAHILPTRPEKEMRKWGFELSLPATASDRLKLAGWKPYV